MQTTSPQVLAQSLAAVGELLASVNHDLEAAPAWKRSTRWWADRVQARQELLAQRDRLRSQLRQLAEMN